MAEDEGEKPGNDNEPRIACPRCGATMRPTRSQPAAVIGKAGFRIVTMQCEACPYSEPRLV